MDAEFRKALNSGAKWAETGDRADPGSANITPQLARSTGFPASYSQTDGNTPDRRRINQLYRELYGAAFETVFGISPYDPLVNYPVDAITQVTGKLYRAKVTNGPAAGNSAVATNPVNDSSEAVWERVSGSVTAPEAPRDALFDNSINNEISVRWKNGRDGGARVLSYDFQYRTRDADPWSPDPAQSLQYAQNTISGLTSGQVVRCRIRARSSEGPGDWYYTPDHSPNSTVRGNVPSGGNALGLIGSPNGSGVIRLRWNTPFSNGGYSILRYRIQWRTGSQTFSADYETTTGASARSDNIEGLVNGTLYYFRVRAENREGGGQWSNVAEATPSADSQALVQPTPLPPSVSRSGATIRGDARWRNSSTAPTATPTQAKWEWRQGTGGTWTSGGAYRGLTNFTSGGKSASQIYQIRALLVTSLGETDWSDPATIAATQVVTAPGAPGVSLTKSSFGGTSNVFINWTAPNNGGRPITAWYVRATWDFGSNRSYSTSFTGQNARSTSFGITHLPTEGGTVRVYVRANNGTNGPWGSSSISIP